MHFIRYWVCTSTFELVTEKSIKNVSFSKNDILLLIQGLNSNKAHGWDDISSKMIKICDESIVDPLYIIFKNCVERGIFPSKWKRANVTPIHKKDEKNLVKNYRPISLLPLFGKIFEKLIFNNLYSYLKENGLISSKQSGFTKGDSTINQLLSIVEMIHASFDCQPTKEVRAIFPRYF